MFQILGGKPGTPFGVGCWGTNTTTGHVQVGCSAGPPWRLQMRICCEMRHRLLLDRFPLNLHARASTGNGSG